MLVGQPPQLGPLFACQFHDSLWIFSSFASGRSFSMADHVPSPGASLTGRMSSRTAMSAMSVLFMVYCRRLFLQISFQLFGKLPQRFAPVGHRRSSPPGVSWAKVFALSGTKENGVVAEAALPHGGEGDGAVAAGPPPSGCPRWGRRRRWRRRSGPPGWSAPAWFCSSSMYRPRSSSPSPPYRAEYTPGAAVEGVHAQAGIVGDGGQIRRPRRWPWPSAWRSPRRWSRSPPRPQCMPTSASEDLPPPRPSWPTEWPAFPPSLLGLWVASTNFILQCSSQRSPSACPAAPGCPWRTARTSSCCSVQGEGPALAGALELNELALARSSRSSGPPGRGCPRCIARSSSGCVVHDAGGHRRSR